MQDTLARLLDGHDLSRAEARAAMDSIMRGDVTPGQLGGFLVALRLKGETAEEIAGCAEAMREHVLPVRPEREDLVDTAGTGGDGGKTFNISTAAALVAAAAGAGVAKHGNRAVSSASGSADVLEALGFRLDLEPERIARGIDELGFGFLFAPTHHPAMRHAAPVRRELAARTVFNVLGPLTNPAGARAQVVGVYAPEPRPDAGRRARPARCAARIRRPRRRGDRRALARRAEPRLRGGRRRGDASARSTRWSSASPAARPRSCAAAAPRTTRARSARSSPAATAAGATRSCSTRRAPSPRADTHATSPTASATRGKRSRRARRASGWKRSSPSRRPNGWRPDGTLPGRAGSARPRCDRRGEAALAVGRRPATRRRPGPARTRLRDGRRGRGLRARGRALRRYERGSESGPRDDGAAAARQGLLLDPGRAGRAARAGSRRRAAAPARPRRCAGDGAARRCERARPGRSRRGSRRRRARPRGAPRRRSDRRQRARPRHLPRSIGARSWSSSRSAPATAW